jgi:hypothetical protein
MRDLSVENKRLHPILQCSKRRNLNERHHSIPQKFCGLQGMMSGFEAYKVYTALDAMSDSQLKAKGMDRAELPAIAMKTFTEACKA